MTTFSKHTVVCITAFFGMAGMTACSESTAEPEINDGKNVYLSFSRSGDSSVDDEPTDVDVYIFKGDELVKVLHSDNPQDEPIKIKQVGDGMIFSTSGTSLDVTEGKTTAEEMALMIEHCPEGAASAPLFLSASAVLDDEVYSAGKLSLSPVRSVARIDLVNTADPSITINEVVIENAPAATYVFPGEKVLQCETMRFAHTFQEAFQGTNTGLFTIFESERPVGVRIRGFHGETPMDMATSLPRIERNHVYTLQVINSGSKIETTFEIKDWEEGGEIGAGPELGNGITIDPVHSVFPQGVAVDYENNIITVPSSGVEGLKLAFKSDTKIELSSIDGLIETASVSENPLETVGDGYISSFNIGVEPQGKGKLGYSVILHLRNALLSQSYDYVEVRVEKSPYQIETVMIGGHEWMCFNATSSELEEQIYIIDGVESVQDMYEQYYAQCVGNYFQYGRPNPYSPWTSNDPNAVTMPTDAKPWTNPAYTPLPEGYHIASFQEWEDLIPNNSTIPSEYTCRTGERIKASVVTLPGYLVTNVAAIDGKNYLMRYVLFESLDTGNKLFVPICSQKSASTSVQPGLNGARFEKSVTYWVENDRSVWYIDYRNTDGVDGAYMKEDKFNYNGFCPVRGIKNPQ